MTLSETLRRGAQCNPKNDIGMNALAARARALEDRVAELESVWAPDRVRECMRLRDAFDRWLSEYGDKAWTETTLCYLVKELRRAIGGDAK